MSRLTRGIATAALTVAQATVAWGQMIVVDSTAAGFQPGQPVAEGQPLHLAAGDKLTLLAPNGRVVRLAGPADTVAVAEAPENKGDGKTVLASLAALVKARQSDTSGLGTFRAAGTELPDPWLVDVDSPGRRCVLDGQPLVLWRADGARAARTTLGRPATGWKAVAEWPAGSQRVFAPEALGLDDGEVLTVALAGREVELSLRRVPAAVRGDAMRLAWLVESGCDAQAAALVRQME